MKSASNREAVARIRARVLCVFASWLRVKEKRNANKMRIRGGINGERKSNLANRFFFVRFQSLSLLSLRKTRLKDLSVKLAQRNA